MTSKGPGLLVAVALLCLTAGVAGSLSLLTRPVAAQTVKDAGQKTCEGKVVGDNNQPVSGAVVYLKDPKSLAIRSYLSDEQGHFHFSQLQPDTDYEVWAESGGKQSKTKRIGMFDNHNKFDFTLKMQDK